MSLAGLDGLCAGIADCTPTHVIGRVAAIERGVIRVTAGQGRLAIGDRVRLLGGSRSSGEVVALNGSGAAILAEGAIEGVRIDDPVECSGPVRLSPADDWLGRIIDPLGRPMDGRALFPGDRARDLRAQPPDPARRRRLGQRIDTGSAAFDTVLPIVRGQRVGLFAGSGVGKSTLLGTLARGVRADVVVLALIGERGRELREFAEEVIGPAMSRTVIVAATSDQSPLVRRRCAWSAMAVAEHFRDRGRHVLLMADSVTRFAEAHREIALAAGESPSFRGHPPSLAQSVMSLAERAGPGAEAEGMGDITAVFTVLVAGSDMNEPVADVLRGVLDGHVVLDRAIAERGRFPAIDLLRSVSRSLPAAASAEENALIGKVRRLLGAYARTELMIQSGLYVAGTDAEVDEAIRLWPALDAFLAEEARGGARESFARLSAILSSREILGAIGLVRPQG
ncbi:FliI/YscN family ATPase [Albidovulum sediminis]|uniref:FliI/YscN family ATPase n=1 Tax=Albidovulum sediminis TaxID=3066345 RepID=A0ABT2NS03_9RHOB|nr:FliI/YscN family ATPase [Defluviimonas sediminis]MCT8331707.1 FliI/YscN family ATPase [Defluviimonas sediminis]